MRAKKIKKIKEYAPVESYKHQDQRLAIPTQELSEFISVEQKRPTKTTYKYDPSLDPQLIWAGKEEKTELNVDSVLIYIQEKISPEAIIAKLRDEGGDTGIQYQLFGDVPDQSLNKIVDFYKHNDNWRNRLILGDSLRVMNSLLEKEGMRGKVQMIYIDPPYGIKFGSNWQNRSDKKEVKDGRDDELIRQPEQIKAYRDTWELGIHSYLSYLRDRFILTYDLLSESGSCFVQIGDENIHLVRSILDETFHSENFIGLITFRKKNMQFGAKYIEGMTDYLLWYAKDKTKTKYHPLFQSKDVQGASRWNWIELPDGTNRTMSNEEWNNHKLLPKGSRIYTHASLRPSGFSENMVYDVEYKGKKYKPPKGSCWITTREGMLNLIELNRIAVENDNLRYKLFLDDYPVERLH